MNHPSLLHHLDCVQGKLASETPLFSPSFARSSRIRHGCRSTSPPWTTMRSPLCPFIASSARVWLLSTVAFERKCSQPVPCMIASTTTSSPYCCRRSHRRRRFRAPREPTMPPNDAEGLQEQDAVLPVLSRGRIRAPRVAPPWPCRRRLAAGRPDVAVVVNH